METIDLSGMMCRERRLARQRAALARRGITSTEQLKAKSGLDSPSLQTQNPDLLIQARNLVDAGRFTPEEETREPNA